MDYQFRNAVGTVEQYLFTDAGWGYLEAIKYLSEHPDFDMAPQHVKDVAYEMYHEGAFDVDYICGPF